MYFLTSMAVSFGTVFLCSLLGYLFSDRKSGSVLGFGLIAAILYGLVLWLVRWLGCFGIYGPAPLFWPIIFGLAISLVVILPNSRKFSESLPSVIAIALYLLYVVLIVCIIQQPDIWHSRGKAELIGQVENVSDLTKVMEPADPARLCLVSEEMALVSAQNALSKFQVTGDAIAGSRYMIGEPTKQFIDGQLWWIFPVEFIGWLKWRMDPQVPGYLRVSAQNPYLEAQAVQTDKDGNEIHIKYLNSACWGYKAERHLRQNGYMGRILSDWTFEPDDNWRPYYTVSVLKRNFGFYGYTVEGVVVLDLQTGGIQFYDVGSLPAWVDRGIPLDALDYQIGKWGKFARAGWWYCLWHNDKSQEATPGWFMTYSQDGRCQWFSGFTSITEQDKALTGFTVSEARIGKTVFFKASGVTESIAYNTARSLWSNFEGYAPTELVPYNVYGRLTYVIPMMFEGQFKGVSLVSLNNINVKAKGETIEEALSNYRASIAQAGSDMLTPEGGALEVMKVTGVVTRVGSHLSRDNSRCFRSLLKVCLEYFRQCILSLRRRWPWCKQGTRLLSPIRKLLRK